MNSVTIGLGIIGLYFAAGAAVLRFALDSSVLIPGDSKPQQHDGLIHVASTESRTLIVRRYGRPRGPVAVFFPGQNGNLRKYEATLFSQAKRHGLTLYAVAYPGQDGSTGSRRISTLEQAVLDCIKAIEAETGTSRSDMAYLGHSLGATIAITMAARSRAKHVLVDGASPSMASAVRTNLLSMTATLPLALLPLKTILPVDYDLRKVMAGRSELSIDIFQGDLDTVTPVSDIAEFCGGFPNIRLHVVTGATHADAREAAGADYDQVFARMADVLRNNGRD